MSAVVDRAVSSYLARPTEGALRQLLQTCRPEVLDLCRRILPNREDSEDAAQRVLLEIARHAGEWPTPAAFRSWVYRVCLARSFDLKRKLIRRQNHESKVEPPGETNGTGQHLAADEAQRALFRALDQLPEDERDLVVAHYFERTSLGILAARLGVSKVAIWKRLERVRRRLRRLMPHLGSAVSFSGMDRWLQAMASTAEPAPRIVPGPLAKAGPATRMAPQGLLGVIVGSRIAVMAASVAAGILMFSLGVIAGTAIKWDPQTAGVSRPIPWKVRGALPRFNEGSFTRGDGAASEETPQPAPPAAASQSMRSDSAGAGNGLADEYKEKLRLLFRQIQRQRRTGKSISAELGLLLSPINDDMRRADQDPSKDPEKYAALVMLLYEVAAEENGLSFSELERRRIGQLGDEFVSALRKVPSSPAFSRLLAVLEADLAVVRGMTQLIPQDENGRMLLVDIDRITRRGSRKSMAREDLTQEILEDWSALLNPDPGQELLMAQASGGLVSELERIRNDFRSRVGDAYDEDDYTKNMLDHKPVGPYDPVRRLEYQIETLRAQVEALAPLQGYLTPVQQRRLNESAPWGYSVSRKGTVIDEQN